MLLSSNASLVRAHMNGFDARFLRSGCSLPAKGFAEASDGRVAEVVPIVLLLCGLDLGGGHPGGVDEKRRFDGRCIV